MVRWLLVTYVLLTTLFFLILRRPVLGVVIQRDILRALDAPVSGQARLLGPIMIERCSTKPILVRRLLTE